jgi:hypothetical protein
VLTGSTLSREYASSFWDSGGQRRSARSPLWESLRGVPGGRRMGPVDVLGGLLAVWDRAWLALVMGVGLVMAVVLHKARPPDEK